MRNKTVIGVVGMPGSGKSIVDDVAVKLGFSIVIMGDIIREAVEKKGLKPTSENIGKIMLEIRAEEGQDAVAEKCIQKIKTVKSQEIIVDGIRSLAEVKLFRKTFPKFKLLSIHSSPKTRFHRIFNRGRSDDPSNWTIFADRDFRELSVGIGPVIAMADHVITNEGNLRRFTSRVRSFMKANINE
ncbi:flagellar hook-basal body complex protein FliE [Candidatus Bathyarchaeota archaeon]|nr:flagellar hook-basal body complex protein FliE [Candidatus Bathyarchaeota archaeon]